MKGESFIIKIRPSHKFYRNFQSFLCVSMVGKKSRNMLEGRSIKPVAATNYTIISRFRLCYNEHMYRSSMDSPLYAYKNVLLGENIH